MPELPAEGERSLTVPLIAEVLSELLITAVGIVNVVGLRMDSWLAVEVDLVIDIECVVAVEFVQGTVIVLVNSITEEDEANSVGVQLALTVEIAEVEVCSIIATGSSG